MASTAQPGLSASRRAFLRTTGGAGAALALSPLARLLAAEALDVNVLLVVCDALRADRLGCYGYRRAFGSGAASTTPNIDALAGRGVLYENCIAQASWTQTSIASLIYSAWPVLKGNEHTFEYVREESRALKDASPGLKRFGIQANPWLKLPIYTRVFDAYRFIESGEYAQAAQMNAEFDWDMTDVVNSKRKFFAYIHYMDPHEPYNYKHPFRATLAPKDWTYYHPLAVCGRVSRYHDDTGKLVEAIPPQHRAQLFGMGEAYDEDVMYLDLHFGKLVEWLKERGVFDDTVIIFTSDHGQSFGEHGWCGHKETLYQEEIHIPLIMAGPGVPAGARVKAQVRGVDILPTLAALAGVSIPGLVGTPLLPVARLEAAGNRPAYSCCDYARYGDVLRLLTCLVTEERLKYIRILTKERKLLREELFDLEADPQERTDLAAAKPELVKQLRGRVEQFESTAYSKHNPERQEMDEKTRRQLEALGYL